ncbi:MAG: hypothetical protein HKL96_10995 [Phycisphaerales bacterium]|nr:hypothetical protein [Phycisphaerales bacterium]
MSKTKQNMDGLKKLATRLIKNAPSRHAAKVDPLVRLVRAFLEYDADSARAQAAEERLLHSMVDYNELRVTPAIELSAILGVRYPFADSRCSALHRTLQAVFDREHHMSLESLKGMKKGDVRNYLKTLAGINPYVEAVVALECYDVPAAPVDMKLTLWLKSKGGIPEEFLPTDTQQALEKLIKATDMLAFYRGARRELDDWSPKVWPAVAKIPSPMLAPPVEGQAASASPPAAPATPEKPDEKTSKGKATTPAPAEAIRHATKHAPAPTKPPKSAEKHGSTVKNGKSDKNSKGGKSGKAGKHA